MKALVLLGILLISNPVYASTVDVSLQGSDFTYDPFFGIFTSRVFNIGAGNTVDFGTIGLGTDFVHTIIPQKSYVYNVIFLQDGMVVGGIPSGPLFTPGYWTTDEGYMLVHDGAPTQCLTYPPEPCGPPYIYYDLSFTLPGDQVALQFSAYSLVTPLPSSGILFATSLLLLLWLRRRAPARGSEGLNG